MTTLPGQLDLFGPLDGERLALATLDSACLDCEQDTIRTGNYYMLRDAVWSQANPADAGMLCLVCVQRRLGRPLTVSDFTHVECNQSPLLHIRLRELGVR